MISKAPTPSKVKSSRFNRKFAFILGLGLGGLLGFGLSGAVSFFYLMVSQESLSVKNGRMRFSKPVVTTTITSTQTDKPIAQGDKSAVATKGSTANTGKNSQVARDRVNSPNISGKNSQVARDRANSPNISGNNNNVTIVASNQDLPGFDKEAYEAPPPSDLKKFSQISDFQPDALIESASDIRNITFEKHDIVIKGKNYTSFFHINWDAYESRFVFKLDGTQKAVLLQFGVGDLSAGSRSEGVYKVKISSDGQLLWAADCKRSQENQIFSVPLDVVGKKNLTIEVSGNGKNETALFFTQARIFKN